MAHAAERIIQFDYKVPYDGAVLRENVRAALASGLPDVEGFRGFAGQTLTIVGNGPSAVNTPFDKAYALALNGSLKLFTERKTYPAYWACVDPKPMVADFVKDAPHETIYLVNSQCHPSVREALRGRTVRLWHSYNDAFNDLLEGRTVIDGGTSITLNAFPLMHMLGYRRFEVYGWDGCYMRDKDHAVPQFYERDKANDVTLRVGWWRKFLTSPTWALEAQQAVHLLGHATYPVKVHGRGMIGAALRHAGVPV